MTAGDRLRSLAGAAGTAGALLLLIGSGATAGAALVNYSRLPTGTAAQHLLTDVARQATGGGFSRAGRRPQIVVVSVDGQDYRIHIDNLAEFLESIKEDVKETGKPKAKAKVSRTKAPQVVIKSAPAEFIATVESAVDRVNEQLSVVWLRYLERNLQELEDEEVLALLLA